MAAGGRRRTGFVFILLALLLILILAVAAFLLRDRFFPTVPEQSQVSTPVPSGEMVNIVVLAQPVTRGKTLTDAFLQLIPYPKAQLVEGLFFTDTQAVVGKRVRMDLQQGVPLTASLLSDAQVGSDRATLIAQGNVAISIPISRLTSVSNGLLPGDRVNILVGMLLTDLDPNFQSRLPNLLGTITTTTDDQGVTTTTITGSTVSQGRVEGEPALNQNFYIMPSESQRARLVSQMIVQDAEVLGVGDFPQPGEVVPVPGAPTPTPAPRAEGAPAEATRPDIITLIVTPQDAVTLNYLMLAGARLNLVLRAAGDEQRNPTETVTLQFVMDQYNIPYPAKLPYGLEPRIDELVYPDLLNGE